MPDVEWLVERRVTRQVSDPGRFMTPAGAAP